MLKSRECTKDHTYVFTHTHKHNLIFTNPYPCILDLKSISGNGKNMLHRLMLVIFLPITTLYRNYITIFFTTIINDFIFGGSRERS